MPGPTRDVEGRPGKRDLASADRTGPVARMRGASPAATAARLASAPPSDVLRLQRAIGNRALAGLAPRHPGPRRLLRSPLGDILDVLPKLARQGHWDDAMADALNDVKRQYGHIPIDDVEVDKKGSANVFDWTIKRRAGLAGWSPEVASIHTDDITERRAYDVAISVAVQMAYFPHLPGGYGFFNESPAGKLIQWLLVGGQHPPGIGSLGNLRIVGTQLQERPGFAGKVIRAMWHPGQARRHITAWHNIRALLNKLVAADAGKWITKLWQILQQPGIDAEIKDEVQRLLPNSGYMYGTLGQAQGQVLVTAAYIMNSKLRNLWLGSSPENSEIARLSGFVQHYLREYISGARNRAGLRLAIASLASSYPKGTTGLGAILAAIDNQPATAAQGAVAAAVIAGIRDFEVDEPPNPAVALGPVERGHHQTLFQYLYQGLQPTDAQIEAMLTFFLSGSTLRA